jgi:hypothetical protein
MGPNGAAWGRMGRMGMDLQDPRYRCAREVLYCQFKEHNTQYVI